VPKYVLSVARAPEGTWPNTTVINGPLADGLARAKHDAGGDLVCCGGAAFAKALLQHDLVDELELFTNPGVAGFVTHDLSVVRQSADEVLVMQLGGAVERGLVDVVLDAPQHRYTQRLIASVPRPGGRPGPVGMG